jgi:hypothetical protein
MRLLYKGRLRQIWLHVRDESRKKIEDPSLVWGPPETYSPIMSNPDFFLKIWWLVAMFCFKNLEMNHMDFFVPSVQYLPQKETRLIFLILKEKFAKVFILNEIKTWLLHIQTLTCCIIHLLPIHLSNKTLEQKCKPTTKFNVPIKTASEFCYN